MTETDSATATASKSPQQPTDSLLLNEPIYQNYLADEEETVCALLKQLPADDALRHRVRREAEQLVTTVRSRLAQSKGVAALLQYYDLSSQEGVTLMCLAEALLRIPDEETVSALIADKLSGGHWHKHLGQSESLFVNASTWALLLTGKVVRPQPSDTQDPDRFIQKLLSRMEAPVVRSAIRHAMRLVAEQFVMGPDIDRALHRAGQGEHKHYLHSYDMLGEAALTEQDAQRYQTAYLKAIERIGQTVDEQSTLQQRPGISVKLSALFPRYEYTQQARAEQVLSQRLLALAQAAKNVGIGLTVDAEEADRLLLSLGIFSTVFVHPALAGWEGLGLAVQAYQKRAMAVLEYLQQLARRMQRRIPVRLVKGAYWDTEIKRAQQQGLQGYPVFTRKNNTDVSYLACAEYLLVHCDVLYPQFATHNAYTVAYLLVQGKDCEFEFQRLHGMGEALYEKVLADHAGSVYCRVYAPVGNHRDLLPYLVRRLLENGANTSFINQMAHPDEPLEALLEDPAEQACSQLGHLAHPAIPLPVDLFGALRRNSRGLNFADPLEVEPLLDAMAQYQQQSYQARPMLAGQNAGGSPRKVVSPADDSDVVGTVEALGVEQAAQLQAAVSTGSDFQQHWAAVPVSERAAMLKRAAALFEAYQFELISLCVREAGKTLQASQADVREAVDFLRYYAAQADAMFADSVTLQGVTGETNVLSLKGRGLFVCISPWNFPVAIFTGQVAAALVAGNCVLAKPASPTCLIAQRIVSLLHEAGIAPQALQFVPASSQLINEHVLTDPRVAGVAFTGSTDSARQISQTLSQRPGPIASLIAETGGQNAMLVDSSALPEQVVLDVVQSAFNSAGQRCSALRVLYLQEDIADRVLDLLQGYMDEMVVGSPAQLHTDVGPVISAEARDALEKHIAGYAERGCLLHRTPLPDSLAAGHFVAPALLAVEGIHELQSEHFGPVLHVARYRANQLETVLDEINATGYGLTFGVHSRIEQRVDFICDKIRAGNLYVNRDMIGAVVGVQPFGGRGLSGTGPKAGGPHYLLAFAVEQTRSVNTAAAGGNALLLNQLQ